eukprot:9477057-Pyramimonas_sp.AAC.1
MGCIGSSRVFDFCFVQQKRMNLYQLVWSRSWLHAASLPQGPRKLEIRARDTEISVTILIFHYLYSAALPYEGVHGRGAVRPRRVRGALLPTPEGPERPQLLPRARLAQRAQRAGARQPGGHLRAVVPLGGVLLGVDPVEVGQLHGGAGGGEQRLRLVVRLAVPTS